MLRNSYDNSLCCQSFSHDMDQQAAVPVSVAEAGAGVAHSSALALVGADPE